MDTANNPRAGVLNGIAVVYDPNIQVPKSRWVLLYAVPHKRLIPYHKAHVRSVAQAHSDHEARLRALGAYSNWRQTTASSVLEDAAEDIRRKDTFLSEKLAKIIETHRCRLTDHSLPYRGVTEPDGRGRIRNALCRECHRAIGTEAHLICNTCNWIICLSCGVCGCGG